MDIQRLRNLTTGRLHTEMEDIYEDMEYLIGIPGIMTHQLPNVLIAMKPWLKERVLEEKFWEDKYDDTHTGDYEIRVMTKEESGETLKRFSKLKSPLFG